VHRCGAVDCVLSSSHLRLHTCVSTPASSHLRLHTCVFTLLLTQSRLQTSLEEDDFERFREQSGQELLTACLQLLRTEFIGTLRARLESPAGGGGAPPPWQQLELVCWATRVLHAELKTTLSREHETLAADPASTQRQLEFNASIKVCVPAEDPSDGR